MKKHISLDTLKIFQKWNNEKMKLHDFAFRKYAQQGQIWLCNLGVNIGSEQNNIRPCLVLNMPIKKERTCIIIPASNTNRNSTIKINQYHFLLHQVRTIDTKRLMRLLERLEKSLVKKVQKELLKILKQAKKTASDKTRSLGLSSRFRARSLPDYTAINWFCK